MSIVGKRIRDLREDMDLKQSDVAQATGLHQKTLSNYETGKTNPDSYAILKLAEFFDVSTDYLLGYSSINIRSAKDIIKKLDEIESEIRQIKRIFK